MRRLAACLALGLAGCGGHGPSDVNVSRAPGAQFETRIAVDPAKPRVLVAVSMGQGSPSSKLLVYGSTDGGVTWSRTAVPDLPGNCAWDPTVAIDGRGRQYVAFARMLRCDDRTGSAAIYVATRPGPKARWRWPRSPAVTFRGPRFDDRPAFAADGGRVYLGWVDYKDSSSPVRVVSTSDGGETWTPPVAASSPGLRTGDSLAVGAHHALYAVWEDPRATRVVLTSSTNLGRTFEPERIVESFDVSTGYVCGSEIPAQGLHQQGEGCVRAVPTVVADRRSGRVYVVWAAAAANRSQDVFFASFDRALRPILAPARINPPDGGTVSDQFLPAAALDPSTGRLWVCFYDTSGDRSRRRTRYSCEHSDDAGASWTRPVRAASAWSDEHRPGATFLGDYTGLAAGGGAAHPIWADSRRTPEEIYTATLRG